ncbi:unnamed protein product [Acanthoscelides obtectus]|uniref:Metalloendopeptidase n=1 Tax=Acanthoscelides obtectus TaxID=200917 RepID=A0A9P0JRZ3_ACAOB|nr:unnamed protein product [Acanthoscelides obtectus]CAK1663819.1 Zinc metalloproteinase nas-4 [Acanthoscelides obtectus]
MLLSILQLVLFFNRVSSFPFSLFDSSEDVLGVDLSFLGEKAFKNPDPEVGKRLENWNASSSENPEELGEYAQGDILLPKELNRNGLIGNSFRWKAGVIPYEIVGFFLPSQLSAIQAAMDLYHTYTCVSFKQKSSSDKDFISISNSGTGCWSSVGKKGGRQDVNLQTPACTTRVGTVVHELMHAAGFLHEQSRPERDDYITIVWQNIKEGVTKTILKKVKSLKLTRLV